MYLLKRYSEQCFISDCSLQEALFIYCYNTKKLSVTPDDTPCVTLQKQDASSSIIALHCTIYALIVAQLNLSIKSNRSSVFHGSLK